MREGSANTQRGAVRFIDELIARVRRADASGQLTVRVDSGFWSNDTIVALNRLNVRYTMAVRCARKTLLTPSQRPETAWVEIDYTPDGQAQVADCAYTTAKAHIKSPAVSWFDAPASPAKHSNDCGPIGGTTRSSPTSTAPPSTSTSSTAKQSLGYAEPAPAATNHPNEPDRWIEA